MGKKLLLKIQTTPMLSRCNSYKKFREKMKSRAIMKEDWRKLATECCIWIIFLVYLKTCKFILNIFCNIEQAKKPCEMGSKSIRKNPERSYSLYAASPFLYSQKTCFWCFQVVAKETSDVKWVSGTVSR